MKKLVGIIPLIALAGCGMFGPSDPYDRAAVREQERQDRLAERAIDRAPKWMTDVPKSDNAVYATGSSVSGDFGMADIKAKNIAYSKICMSAGGTVDQRTQQYMQDSNNASGEYTTSVIRSLCRQVDITGVRVEKIERVAEGGRIRTYVLVALPSGDLNKQARDRDNRRAQEDARRNSERALRELDETTRRD